MLRHLRVAGIGLALALAACEQTPTVVPPSDGAGSTLDASRSSPRVGPGVAEAIHRDGGARVVIALHTAATAPRPQPAIPDLGRLRAQTAALQQTVLDRLDPADLVLVRRLAAVPALAGTLHSEAALARLAADPLVRRIDLDVGGTGSLATSVPQIGADGRHARGNDGEGVVVAVLDTGVETGNPDLAGRVVHEACFGFRPGTPFCPDGSDRQTGPGSGEDDAGHGTHVTGIVASSGAVTSPGVAPAADIAALKVMDDCSFAGCFYSFFEIVAALDHIIVNNEDLNVRIINMSLGTGALFAGYCDDATAWTMAGSDAVNTLRGIGVITFAASGNNGSGSVMPAPACLENVVSVGAVNSMDVVAGFSNSNSTTDIFAPGVSIRSLAIGGGTLPASGTSMASPHAAGCAALLIHAGEATTPGSILDRLKTSPVQVTDPKNGLTFPRIDCSPPPQVCTPRDIDRIWSSGAPPGTVRLSDPELFIANYDVESFLPRAATPGDVRIGSDWETGTPAAGFAVTDINGDGQRDVVVRWSMAALVADGRIGLGPQLIRVWGRAPDTSELFCASTEVSVVP